MDAPAIIVLLASALGAAALVQRRQATWRWTLGSAAIGAALALALINPDWFPTRGAIEVATPGPNVRSATQSWTDQAEPGALVSPQQLALREPQATALALTGAGLPIDVLAELPDIELSRFEGSAPQTGFVRIDYPWQVAPGERVIVEGRFSGAAEAVSLRLRHGPELARVNRAGDFELHFVPRTRGWMNLELVAEDESGGVVVDEPLAVQVIAPQTLSFALQASRPNFEVGALKRWLARAGAEGVVEIENGPGVYHREAINRAEAAMPDLASLDLWIGDTRTWQARQSELRNAANAGLGVIILAGVDGGRTSGSSLPFELTEVIGAKATTVENADDHKLSMELRIRNVDRELDALPSNAAGYRQAGAGRIAVITIIDSHRLITEVGPRAFEQHWASIISQISRPTRAAIQHRFSDRIALRNWRITSCFTGIEVPRITPQPWLILNRHSDAGRRCIDWWPRSAGIHRLESDDDGDLYVHEATAMTAVRQRARHAATRWHHQAGLSAREASSVPKSRPWPAFWWWVLVAVTACVWLVERRSAS